MQAHNIDHYRKLFLSRFRELGIVPLPVEGLKKKSIDHEDGEKLNPYSIIKNEMDILIKEFSREKA
jgi:hypothetical protein